MKIIRNLYFSILVMGLLIEISCHREDVYENKVPVANAGVDQFIYLPATSAVLDGSSSIDVRQAITTYEWKKVGGPASFQIKNKFAVKTAVLELVVGVYQFELTVSDHVFLSKDTIRVHVFNSNANPPGPGPVLCDHSSRPEITARLIPLGKLSGARADMAVVAVGNLILFAGGHGPGTEGWGSSKVDIYNLSSQTWSKAELSSGRYGIAAVAADDKVFLAGGQYGDGAFNTIFSNVDIYDIKSNSWSQKVLSQPRGFLTAAAVGNKVLFAGGEVNWNYDNTDRVDLYDLVSNTWTTATLSIPRSYISAVTVGSKIYFAGGQIDNRWYTKPSFAIDIYDYTTNTWSESILKSPMGFVAGITREQQVYWADGCNVEILDTRTNERTYFNLFRPGSWYNSNGQKLVVRDNKIVFYTYGGFNDEQAAIERGHKFDILDITTNTWFIGVLPQSLQGFSIVSVHDKIYIAGGYVNGVLSDQVWKLEF